MSCQFNQPKQYFALALDPVHIGTGGARLGRVDLPILREPGTKLPKVPGTSLSGPARAYTAMQTGKYQCAGRGGDGGKNHCGQTNPACPVCIPFGFSKGSGNSMQGLAQIFDAHILFFPVASMAGPVWVTSPMALEKLGDTQEYEVSGEGFYSLGGQLCGKGRLNFGWLLISEVGGKGKGTLDNLPEIPKTICQRAVLVSDKLFSLLVNNNLEVRTSVSIDPSTGAAEETALFTYEAIPRGTLLRFEVTYLSGQTFMIGGQNIKGEGNTEIGTEWVKTQVEKGLSLFETLGIGGMNTRGMGRIRILNLEEKGRV